MFILYNFITLYYACFLKFGMENNCMGFNFNRIDELIINMTIVGVVFGIVAFVFCNYVFIEIAHIILAFQVLLGALIYSSHMLSYTFIGTILYLMIFRYKYRKCPYYTFYSEIRDDILLTSYEYNNVCFLLSFLTIFVKKFYNYEV